jgi:hypothetical protein
MMKPWRLVSAFWCVTAVWVGLSDSDNEERGRRAGDPAAGPRAEVEERPAVGGPLLGDC